MSSSCCNPKVSRTSQEKQPKRGYVLMKLEQPEMHNWSIWSSAMSIFKIKSKVCAMYIVSKASPYSNETDQVLHRILQWINPPEFNSELCKCAELREEGTGIWIFDEPRFKEWRYGEISAEIQYRKKFGRNTLWIQGNFWIPSILGFARNILI